MSIEFDKKFIETIEITDLEIETEDGWKDILYVYKTIPYQIFKISTKDYYLECADEHIVIDENFKQIFVKDLKIGDKIFTKTGAQEVQNIEKYDTYENMYDISIDSKKHTFYTNGILSHNSTITTIYVVWYAIFNEDKNVAILANKESTAKEILRRVKIAYENLPLWMQQGIKDDGWSQKSISLENGTRIKCASTSSSGIRGDAISCVIGDTKITLKNTETGEIFDITMEDLENLLEESEIQ